MQLSLLQMVRQVIVVVFAARHTPGVHRSLQFQTIHDELVAAILIQWNLSTTDILGPRIFSHFLL